MTTIKKFEDLINRVELIRNSLKKMGTNSGDKVMDGFLKQLQSNPIMLTDFNKLFEIHRIRYYSSNFNKNVDNLPISITHLTFGESFNKPVDNLPISITHLVFNNNYYQKKEYFVKYKKVEILFK